MTHLEVKQSAFSKKTAGDINKVVKSIDKVDGGLADDYKVISELEQKYPDVISRYRELVANLEGDGQNPAENFDKIKGNFGEDEQKVVEELNKIMGTNIEKYRKLYQVHLEGLNKVIAGLEAEKKEKEANNKAQDPDMDSLLGGARVLKDVITQYRINAIGTLLLTDPQEIKDVEMIYYEEKRNKRGENAAPPTEIDDESDRHEKGRRS